MKPEVKYDLSRLDRFVRGLSQKHYVKVGIMGSKAARAGDATNPVIGAKHEFGSFTDRIPRRSFLRMPLFMMTERILALTSKHSLAALVAGNFRQVFVNLGIACETIIGEAFETSGWGSWKKLSAKTIALKIGKNPKPLINTSQLRRSITSKIEDGK